LKTTPFLSCLGERLSVYLIHPEKGFPPGIISPMEGDLNCSAGHPGPGQEAKGCFRYRALHDGIPGLSTRISQRKIREQEASYTALLNYVPR
jgi:hypothetical protein